MISFLRKLFLNKKDDSDSLHDIISCLDDIILKIDEDMTILACWTADESKLFLPIEKIIGNKIKDLYPEYYIELFTKVIQNTFLLKSSQTIEYKNIFIPEEQWFRARTILLKNKNTNQIVVVISDITVERINQKVHQETLDKLNLVTSHLEDVIWMSDLQKSQMTYISPGYEIIWERSCQSLYDDPMSFLNAIVAEDRNRIIDAFPKQKLGHYHETYRIQTPQGEVKWILDRAFPVRNEKDEVIQIVGIASNITAQKKQEKLISDQQIKMMSTAKMSTLGEMAGSIAHEINNPLMIIQGNAHRLQVQVERDNLNTEDIKIISSKLVQTTDRIAKIIRGLKAFSRNADLDPFTQTSIQAIIEDCLELCQERFKNSGVRLNVNVDLLMTVECRPVQISQVILNLLNNSFDAVVNQKDSWIELSVKKDEENLLFMVTDSGKGILPEIADRMMEPFFSSKEPGKGTGLGLSISKGIIEDHHGKFWYDKNFLHTRFVFQLPITHNL
ncbi:MAG: PAS domain-containing sensor histidine kinase [Bacteriovoracaceae bacterium]